MTFASFYSTFSSLLDIYKHSTMAYNFYKLVTQLETQVIQKKKSATVIQKSENYDFLLAEHFWSQK